MNQQSQIAYSIKTAQQRKNIFHSKDYNANICNNATSLSDSDTELEDDLSNEINSNSKSSEENTNEVLAGWKEEVVQRANLPM